MELTTRQIFEIKIILSGKSKSQISNDLGFDNSYFSKIESHPNIQKKLNQYFLKLIPEIEVFFEKLSNIGLNVIEDSIIGYKSKNTEGRLIQEKDKIIKALEDNIKTLEKLDAFMEQRYQEYQNERDVFIKRIYELENVNNIISETFIENPNENPKKYTKSKVKGFRGLNPDQIKMLLTQLKQTEPTYNDQIFKPKDNNLL